MKAIILAAGRGSRMGQYAENGPKCLVELAGKPLLEWQIAALTTAGIDSISAVRGYKGETLEGRNLVLFDNPRWAETNMVVSLKAAAPWLRQAPCIVSYADIFYQSSAVRLLAEADAPLAITYDVNWHEQWSKRFTDPLSDAETFKLDDCSNVAEIGKRPLSLDQVQGQYMGLLRMTPEGWGWIEAVLEEIGPTRADRLDMTSLLGLLIAAGHPIRAIAFDGLWGECDSPSDLAIHARIENLGPRLSGTIQ